MRTNPPLSPLIRHPGVWRGHKLKLRASTVAGLTKAWRHPRQRRRREAIDLALRRPSAKVSCEGMEDELVGILLPPRSSWQTATLPGVRRRTL